MAAPVFDLFSFPVCKNIGHRWGERQSFRFSKDRPQRSSAIKVTKWHFMLVASLSFPLPSSFLANPASYRIAVTMANDLHGKKGKNKWCDLFLRNHNDSHNHSDQSLACDGQLVLKAKALQNPLSAVDRAKYAV
jgi:hypothetical protein